MGGSLPAWLLPWIELKFSSLGVLLIGFHVYPPWALWTLVSSKARDVNEGTDVGGSGVSAIPSAHFLPSPGGPSSGEHLLPTCHRVCSSELLASPYEEDVGTRALVRRPGGPGIFYVGGGALSELEIQWEAADSGQGLT